MRPHAPNFLNLVAESGSLALEISGAPRTCVNYWALASVRSVAPNLTAARPRPGEKCAKCDVGLHEGPANGRSCGAMAEYKQGAGTARYHATKLNCNCTLPTPTKSPSLSSTLAVRGRPLTETFLAAGDKW